MRVAVALVVALVASACADEYTVRDAFADIESARCRALIDDCTLRFDVDACIEKQVKIVADDLCDDVDCDAPYDGRDRLESCLADFEQLGHKEACAEISGGLTPCALEVTR